MKIKLYTTTITIMACMYFASCKKDHKKPAGNADGTYNFHISVANFNQTISNNTINSLKIKTLSVVSNPDSLFALAPYYELAIYDSNKQPVYDEFKGKNSTGYGTFDTKLPPGTYRVCLVGYNSRYVTIYSDRYLAFIQTTTDANKNLNMNQWSPVYCYSQPLTINNADVSTTATLTRVTSQLVINITDAIPSGVFGIQVTPSYNYAGFNFYDYKPQQLTIAAGGVVVPQTLKDTIPASAKGKTGFQMVYNLLMDSTISVDIVAYAANYNASTGVGLIAKKTVNNVNIKPNDRLY